MDDGRRRVFKAAAVRAKLTSAPVAGAEHGGAGVAAKVDGAGQKSAGAGRWCFDPDNPAAHD